MNRVSEYLAQGHVYLVAVVDRPMVQKGYARLFDDAVVMPTLCDLEGWYDRNREQVGAVSWERQLVVWKLDDRHVVVATVLAGRLAADASLGAYHQSMTRTFQDEAVTILRRRLGEWLDSTQDSADSNLVDLAAVDCPVEHPLAPTDGSVRLDDSQAP